ncbi:hypothetical protein [Sharpea azabuensis]|uniref:hypothetical protein n=1 Tax=Sharpea azabuensis TaxID=322505 RepID=UPI0023F2D315|nr:hypothetical protein [Sharpea azabuensis]
MRNSSRHVTDNCKYYYLYGAPINVAYICDSKPFYDEEDKYYIQSIKEITAIINKAGIDEATNFVNAICNVRAMGVVDANLMLKQIHQFSTQIDRNTAFSDYNRWISSQKYSCIYTNEHGDSVRQVCTRYIAHSFYGTDHEPAVEYTLRNKKNKKRLTISHEQS